MNRDLERFTGDPFRANGSMPWLQLDSLASADQIASFEHSLETSASKSAFRPACKFFQYNKDKPEMLNSALMPSQEAKKRQARASLDSSVRVKTRRTPLVRSKSCCSVLNGNESAMKKESICEDLARAPGFDSEFSVLNGEESKSDETLVESAADLVSNDVEPVTLKRKNNMPDNSSSEFKKLKNDDKICTFDDLLRSFNCQIESNRNEISMSSDKGVLFELGAADYKESAFSNFISRFSDPVKYSSTSEPLTVQTNLSCSEVVSKSETFLDALFKKSSQNGNVPAEPVKKTNIFDKLFSPQYQTEAVGFNCNSFNLMTSLTVSEPEEPNASNELNEKLMKESTNLLKLILKIDSSQSHNSTQKPIEEPQQKPSSTLVLAKPEAVLKPIAPLTNNQNSSNGLKKGNSQRKSSNHNSQKLHQQQPYLDDLQPKKNSSLNFSSKSNSNVKSNNDNKENKENVTTDANSVAKSSKRKYRRGRKVKKENEPNENQVPQSKNNSTKNACGQVASKEKGNAKNLNVKSNASRF